MGGVPMYPDEWGPDGWGRDGCGPDECGPDGWGPDGCGPDGCGPDGWGPGGWGPDGQVGVGRRLRRRRGAGCGRRFKPFFVILGAIFNHLRCGTVEPSPT